jgi:hypothetical protein
VLGANGALSVRELKEAKRLRRKFAIAVSEP